MVAVPGSDRAGRSQDLPPDPRSPAIARVLVRAVCQAWEMTGDLCDDAALVVTELVANVVDHAATSCRVKVDADGRELRIEVRDFYPCPPPRPGPVDLSAVRGRGLQVVAALSTRWGVIEFADGKCMWAVLAPPMPREEPLQTG